MSEQSATTNETAVSPAEPLDYEAHIYDWGRCIFCNVNDLDESAYGPFECIQRGQFIYTTATPAVGSQAQHQKGIYRDCFSR